MAYKKAYFERYTMQDKIVTKEISKNRKKD